MRQKWSINEQAIFFFGPSDHTYSNVFFTRTTNEPVIKAGV